MDRLKAYGEEDGEWTLVITSDLDPKCQCGGTWQTLSGEAGNGQCLELPSHKACGNIEVNNRFRACEFHFKPKSCDDLR